MLTFQLLQHNYVLSFNQVNEAMGVDLNRGPLADRFSMAFYEFKKAAKSQFYHHISRDTGEFTSYKRDYWIVHPTWVLAHRVLSTSLTSRREAGQLNSIELFILYCMHKKLPVDFCDFFLEKCDLIRSRCVGDIGIGGLVTLLAQAVNLDFDIVHEMAKGADDDIFLTMNVLQSMQLVNYNQNKRIDWYTADETDPKIKHPCFELTHQFMKKFKLQRKNTWKPKFHYVFPTFQPTRVHERGQSSGGGVVESDEEMEEGEDEESSEEAEEEEEEVERDELDDHPLSVYQQLGRLRISNQNILRNQEQMFTGLQNVTSQLQNVANTQAAMQHNFQFMQQQQHDMWSYLRPESGYPSYPPYLPPPSSYYPYPPPPGGYPPYYQPPPGGSSQ